MECLNCCTCAFWDSYEGPSNHGECCFAAWIDDRREVKTNNGIYREAYASDDTGLSVKVITGRSFGCNRHRC